MIHAFGRPRHRVKIDMSPRAGVGPEDRLLKSCAAQTVTWLFFGTRYALNGFVQRKRSIRESSNETPFGYGRHYTAGGVGSRGCRCGAEHAAGGKPPSEHPGNCKRPHQSRRSGGRRQQLYEGQAKSRIEKAGHTNVSSLAKDKDGIWRGKANNGSANVPVALDYQGNVVPK